MTTKKHTTTTTEMRNNSKAMQNNYRDTKQQQRDVKRVQRDAKQLWEDAKHQKRDDKGMQKIQADVKQQQRDTKSQINLKRLPRDATWQQRNKTAKRHKMSRVIHKLWSKTESWRQNEHFYPRLEGLICFGAAQQRGRENLWCLQAGTLDK